MTRPTPDDLADRIQLMANVIPALHELRDAIETVRFTHTEDWSMEISESEQTDTLVTYTLAIVRLNINLAAYPVGYTTAMLFDMDGHPI